MSALSVRPATTDDLAAIVGIAHARPHTAKWPVSALTPEIASRDSVFLVADERGEVRGYALARIVAQDCRLLDLAAICDGSGCGRALLSSLILFAKARGCAKVSFEASSANARALLFYRKAGAEVVGRRPKFYNDGSDAVLMDLNIS